MTSPPVSQSPHLRLGWPVSAFRWTLTLSYNRQPGHSLTHTLSHSLSPSLPSLSDYIPLLLHLALTTTVSTILYIIATSYSSPSRDSFIVCSSFLLILISSHLRQIAVPAKNKPQNRPDRRHLVVPSPNLARFLHFPSMTTANTLRPEE